MSDNEKLKVGGKLIIRNADDSGYGDLDVGNLNVYGTTTTIESVTLAVFDNIITLSANVSGSELPSLNAGIEVNRGSEPKAQIIWDETTDQWTLGIAGNMGNVLDTSSPQILYNKTLYSPASYFGTISVSGSATIEALTANNMVDGYITGMTGNNIGVSTSIKNAILSLDDITELTQEPHGFSNRTDSTISFDNGTRKLTLAPTGTNFSVYYQGKKLILTSQDTTIVDTTAIYFCYLDSDGILQNSTTYFDLFNQIPVAIVIWNSSLANGILCEERHGIQMDIATHNLLHLSDGAKYLTGFGISGYTIGAASDVGNTFGIDSGTFADEDITHLISALSDGGPYVVFYKSGASGDFYWSTGNSVPFLISSAIIAYNQWTGVTWTQAQVSETKYCNYFLLATNAVYSTFSFILLQGQNTYSTLSDAKLESYTEMNLTGLPFQEIVPLWQFTFKKSSGYSSTGKASLEAIQRLLGERLTIAGTAIGFLHNSLPGRSDADAHPASAISVDDSTWSYSLSGAFSDLQSVLNRIDVHHHAILKNGTGIEAFSYNGLADIDTLISVDFTGSDGAANSASRSDHGHNPLTFYAISTPASPSADRWKVYVKASGATPNREVALCSLDEAGDEFIISSVLV